jgi:hypothetical protein
MVKQTRLAEMPEPFDGIRYQLAECVSKVTLTDALTENMVKALSRHPVSPNTIISQLHSQEGDR